MEAKEYLSQARRLDRLINARLEELHRLKLAVKSISSPYLSDRVQSGGKNNTMQIIDKIMDLQSKINNEIDKLVDLKAEIRRQINTLSDERFVTVLTEYYINCKTFEQISSDNFWSLRHVMRLHGWALQAFKQKYDMT